MLIQFLSAYLATYVLLPSVTSELAAKMDQQRD